jgi:FkbM family methyltransferase
MTRSKAFLIATVTPVEQRQGISQADQRRHLEAFAVQRGWDVVGVSERLRHDSLKGIDKVVVQSLANFNKRPLQLADILEAYQRAGVGLVSIAEGIDTGDGSGEALARVVRLVAEGEWWDWRAANLRKEWLAPATVIDVGVLKGTPTLYQAFPDAYHVLIEPLEEFWEHIEGLLAQLRGELVQMAVGAREGVLSLNVTPDFQQTSALERVLPPPSAIGEVRPRDVPVTTLDALLEQRGWEPPFGVKLDIEGLEYDAISGATRLLEQTQFVIAELSIAKRFERDHSFADFASLMESRGFDLNDFLHVRRAGGRTIFVDALFRTQGE